MSPTGRPTALLVIAGTGTEVGKTWVGAALISCLRAQGRTVVARKPAQSFDRSDTTTDAAILGEATNEDPHVVCPPPRWYATPMAPPMAADALGEPSIALDDLVDELTASWPERAPDVGLVELAGGLRSPMAHDGDGVDLIERLDPALVVLVADAGLGTINAVRLSLDALVGRPVLVVLNRFDPTESLHAANRDWLVERCSAPVVVSVDDACGWIVEHVLVTHCVRCGNSVTDCDGTCAGPLEAPHHCPICARKLVVTIIPTGVTARCRVHGVLDLS